MYCKYCKLDLDESFFHNDNSLKTGKVARCKECKKKQRKYRKDNPKIKNVEGFKQCSSCKKLLDNSSFYNDKSTPSGLSSACKSCNKNIMKNFRKNNPDIVIKRREKYKESLGPYLYWARSSINHHKRQNSEICFSAEDLAEFSKNKISCPWCKIELSWGSNTLMNSTPSLENLNLKKVLQLDDIEIVCFKCNTSKSDRTLSDYIEYIEKILPGLKSLLESKQATL